MPFVPTLHTVLPTPSPTQQGVLEALLARAGKTIVMSEKGRELLRDAYNASDDKISVVPHGIPDYPFNSPDEAKAKFGFSERMVLLTFGLLSPTRGSNT